MREKGGTADPCKREDISLTHKIKVFLVKVKGYGHGSWSWVIVMGGELGVDTYFHYIHT